MTIAISRREKQLYGAVFFLIGWCYKAKRQGQNRILKVTLRNRANQLRIFTEPGKDYYIPVPSSFFYELSFFVTAANILI